MRQALICVALAVAALSQEGLPFVPISVWYPPSADVDAMRRDFPVIQNAGFNAVTTWVRWSEGEPRRGAYNLLDLDRLIAVASEAGLRVRVDVLTDPPPAWKNDGTNALAGSFFEYVRKRVASHPAVVGVSLPGTNPPDENRRAVVGPGRLTLRQARMAMWSAIAGGSRGFGFSTPEGSVDAHVLALGEIAGVITRNAALFAPLRPRRLQPGEVTITDGANVSVSILESSAAIAIIAINRSTEVRKVTITFPSDTPEAVWQNMEAGNAVHFVMGSTGPFLDHTFAAEDVLVLAISRKLR